MEDLVNSYLIIGIWINSYTVTSLHVLELSRLKCFVSAELREEEQNTVDKALHC